MKRIIFSIWKQSLKMNKSTILLQLIIAQTLIKTISAKVKPSKDNVVFLVELARHGAKSPKRVIHKSKWTQQTEAGELTPVGQRQRLMLGLNTLHRYKKFLKGETGSSKLKANEYWVVSTYFNRTRVSAFSHIFGMFNKSNKNGAPEIPFEDNTDPRMDPPQKLLFNKSEEIDFTSPLPRHTDPLSVHTFDTGTDEYLSIIEEPCPPIRKTWKASIQEMAEYVQKSEKFVEMVRKAKSLYNLPADWKSDKGEFKACKILSDFTLMDNLHNPNPVIDGINGSEEEKGIYLFLEKCYYAQLYQRMNNSLVNKIGVSPVLDQMVTWFERKISESEQDFPLKYVHFSGHCSTINPFLSILKLGLSNASCLANDLYDGVSAPNPNCSNFPSVGSNIIWELILKPGREKKEKRSREDFIVKFSYNGDYLDYCLAGVVDQFGDHYCELADFYNLAKTEFFYKDYIDYCGLTKYSPDDELSSRVQFVLAIVGAFAAIFGVLLLILLRNFTMLRRISKRKME